MDPFCLSSAVQDAAHNVMVWGDIFLAHFKPLLIQHCLNPTAFLGIVGQRISIQQSTFWDMVE